jgi:hypothetical protein
MRVEVFAIGSLASFDSDDPWDETFSPFTPSLQKKTEGFDGQAICSRDA